MKSIAVCVLAKSHSRLKGYLPLIRRNISVSKSIRGIRQNKSYLFKHIIFHESTMGLWDRLAIRLFSLPARLSFRNVDHLFKPRTLPATSAYCWKTELSRKAPYGYKCMCSFWFYDFLQETCDFDYVARIDDDCYVAQLPWNDVLLELDSGRSAYICAAAGQGDHADVTIGLDNLVSDFIADKVGLRQPVYDNNPYTNLSIINRSAFEQDNLFQQFSALVIDSGCIHINRWGDLPLWGAFLSIHPSPSLLSVRRDIQYYHASHSCPVNISRGQRDAGMTPQLALFLLLCNFQIIVNRFVAAIRVNGD